MSDNQCRICGGRAEFFSCWECAKAIKELLVGHQGYGGEPGMLWHIRRLKEHAYRESRLTDRIACRRSGSAFYLLGDARAVDLLVRVHICLGGWVERLSGPLSPDSAPLAMWLANHLVALMNEPEIKRLSDDLIVLSKESTTLINRREEEFAGPCVTVEDDKRCGVELYCPRGDTEVTCPKCRKTNTVIEIRRQALDRLTNEPQTATDWFRWMRLLGEDLPPRSTFFALVARLSPVMWAHSDGRRNQIKSHGAKPLYRYYEVLQVLSRGRREKLPKSV